VSVSGFACEFIVNVGGIAVVFSSLKWLSVELR
jgi:hypothetical protein